MNSLLLFPNVQTFAQLSIYYLHSLNEHSILLFLFAIVNLASLESWLSFLTFPRWNVLSCLLHQKFLQCVSQCSLFWSFHWSDYQPHHPLLRYLLGLGAHTLLEAHTLLQAHLLLRLPLPRSGELYPDAKVKTLSVLDCNSSFQINNIHSPLVQIYCLRIQQNDVVASCCSWYSFDQ